MSNELEKAIRYFKNMRDDNKVVLDSGFGMKKGENNLLYKNRCKLQHFFALKFRNSNACFFRNLFIVF